MDVTYETQKLANRAKKIQIDDEDTIDVVELSSFFPQKLHASVSTLCFQKNSSGRKPTAGKRDPLVLYTDISPEEDKIVCGLSNDQIKSIDPNRLVDSIAAFQSLSHRHNGLSCVRCSKVNSSVFFSSSCKEGTVFQWDQREDSYKPAQKFNLSKDSGSSGPLIGKIKPILSLDVNQNDQILCAGTELVDDDSYLLFWDVRSSKLLGAYWESHSDDVTTVKFNADKTHLLASGSTDGLLNVFSLLETTEDDALQYSFNTDSSVDCVEWGTPKNMVSTNSHIACLTHTNELHIYDVDSGDRISKFERHQVAESMKRSNPEAVYLNACYRINQQGSLGLLASSLAGGCARTLSIHETELKPCSLFSDQTSIIHTAQRFSKTDRWLTFDEDGFGKLWEAASNSSTNAGSTSTKGGEKHKKSKRFKPYNADSHS